MLDLSKLDLNKLLRVGLQGLVQFLEDEAVPAARRAGERLHIVKPEPLWRKAALPVALGLLGAAAAAGLYLSQRRSTSETTPGGQPAAV